MGYNVFGSLEQSMTGLWMEVMRFLPGLLLAILVLVLGWIIGGVLSGVVRRGFKILHLDTALDKAGVDTLSEKAGFDFKPGVFVGALVKWFVIIAFALVAFEILNLSSVTYFIQDVVLGYLPNVFAAVLILFASVLIANVASKTLSAALRTGGGDRPDFFGKLAYYSVVAFGILAVLNQLQIADELVQTLFTGVVFAASLAIGLSFGLGGKETAAKYLEKMTHKNHH